MPSRDTQFSVAAPPEALWAFIRDIESLCTCIPGVERVSLIDDRSADLTVKEKVGVIPMIVTLRATIETEEPPRRLRASAIAEHLTMDIEVHLERTVAGTELRGRFDVVGTGQLKPIVDRLFEKRATERAEQFAAALEARFGAAAQDGSDAQGSARGDVQGGAPGSDRDAVQGGAQAHAHAPAVPSSAATAGAQTALRSGASAPPPGATTVENPALAAGAPGTGWLARLWRWMRARAGGPRAPRG